MYARSTFIAIVALVWLGTAEAVAWEVLASDERRPREFEGVGVTEHLGDRIDLDLAFTDHEGRRVRLGDLVAGERPLLLTLNYFECPSVCTVQLNGLTQALAELDLPGEEFRVATLSIDPREGVSLAWEKRSSYVDLLARNDIDWTFLVGGELPIRMLAEQLGFGYRYDAASGDFAHQPTVFLIGSDGTITRYLYGLTYSARDVKFALIEAGDGEVGTTIDRIWMTCFHYVDGSYAPWAYGFMRIGGIVVVALMAIFLVVMWRREPKRRRAEAAR